MSCKFYEEYATFPYDATFPYLDLLDLWLFEGWDRFDLLLFEANKYQNCPKYPKSTN